MVRRVLVFFQWTVDVRHAASVLLRRIFCLDVKRFQSHDMSKRVLQSVLCPLANVRVARELFSSRGRMDAAAVRFVFYDRFLIESVQALLIFRPLETANHIFLVAPIV